MESITQPRQWRFGATGHRAGRLGRRGVDALIHIAIPLLDWLERAGAGDHPTLVTCAADGADAVLANAALAAGWRLELILPFPHADYRRDFTGAALADLDRQCHAAALVTELSGCDNERAGRAYQRAGAAMLARSDLLIAVWDGEPGRGPGGTVTVIADAVARAIPVLTIDPTQVRPMALLVPTGEGSTLDAVSRVDVERFPAVMATTLAGEEATR